MLRTFTIDELTTNMRGTTWSDERAGHAEETISAGGLELDCSRRRLRKGGWPIHLTPKECALLRVLMACPGTAVPHRRLLNLVWRGPAARNIGHLRTLVRQLRKKIEDDPSHPRYVQTVSEVGYAFGDLSEATVSSGDAPNCLEGELHV